MKKLLYESRRIFVQLIGGQIAVSRKLFDKKINERNGRAHGDGNDDDESKVFHIILFRVSAVDVIHTNTQQRGIQTY